ncbi:MAG: S1 RNA-binding domain-containing protein [Dethiobacter sp.]|jgi:ribosomal protein S1|nr:S1 RNA-binding domain-containing protein [Dethiobacter sp.]
MMQDIMDIKAKTEGFTGEVESLEQDYMPVLYASMQNKLTLQAYPVGVEKFPVRIKTHEDGMLVQKEYRIPSFVFHFGTEVKGVIPVTHSGLLDIDDDTDPTEAYLALPSAERNETAKRMQSYIGKLLVFKVTAINDNVAMLSRIDALRTMAAKTWQELEEGQVRLATARKILPWGVLCDIGGITAVLPAREVTHGVIPPDAVLEEGKTYNAKVLKIDKESGRVIISTKALLRDPWNNVPLKYKKGNIHLATVTGVLESGKGFFVTLEPGVTAVTMHPAHFSPKKGSKVLVFIQAVDTKKKRIFASMRKLISPS